MEWLSGRFAGFPSQLIPEGVSELAGPVQTSTV